MIAANSLDRARLNARVDRARGATLLKCNYKLGRGGFKASKPANWDQERSDCSGFVSWVLMTQRGPKPGRMFWIETTAIYKDATGPCTAFVRLDEPIPGCMVVYGDSKGKEGHIGIVVDVQSVNVPHEIYTTVECASGLLGRMGKAIRERKNAENLFGKRKAVFVALKEDIA